MSPAQMWIPPKIPRIIHQMWIGSDVPPEYAEYAHDWRHLHPEWEYIFWDETAIAQFDLHNWRLYSQADAVSPTASHQYASDVARYEILYDYGGVWVDMDFKPQKRLDELCAYRGESGWMAWEVEGKWLNNAVMGFHAGHPVLQEAIMGLGAASHRMGGNTLKSGPQYITPIALKHNVWTYPKHYFYPYLWNELDREGEEFPDSYAVHRWNNRRSRK